MKKVDQTIICKGNGDCFRAAIASIFELAIEQVPHFTMYDERWNDLFLIFLDFMGWEYWGVSANPKDFKFKNSFNGFYLASVESATFKGVFHSVILDKHGVVVHDPNPNKKWLGKNALTSGKLFYWYLVSKKNEDS